MMLPPSQLPVSLPPAPTTELQARSAWRRVYRRVTCSEAPQPQHLLDLVSARVWDVCKHGGEDDDRDCECYVQEVVYDMDPLYFSSTRADGQLWLDVHYTQILHLEAFFCNGSSWFYKVDGNAVKTNSTEDTVRQIKMSELAADCAVKILGRFWGVQGWLNGMVMPMEQDLDLAIDANAKWTLARELVDLMRHLHAKNIIHGDVKTNNILRCSDGKIRFIDFDNASVEGEDFTSGAVTAEYTSPRRLNNLDDPITKADDIYGLGVTLWQLFAGMPPFAYEGCDPIGFRGLVEDGAVPDLTYIQDLRARRLISSCFEGVLPSVVTNSE